MKRSLSALLLMLLLPSLGLSQSKADPTPPKPAPEVQNLGYYVGTWKGAGEAKAGPFGPAGNLSSNMTCEWFTGGFQVVCRGEEMGPTGKRAFLNILSYDQEKKTYTEYSISNLGESEYDRDGSFVDGKLIFLLDQDADGKPAKIRYTEAHVSPDYYTYKAEAAINGAPWMTMAEGKITRVK